MVSFSVYRWETQTWFVCGISVPSVVSIMQITDIAVIDINGICLRLMYVGLICSILLEQSKRHRRDGIC